LRSVLRRINAILHDIARNPFKGIGKPEPLRGDLAGWWSRRITGDHRTIYRALGGAKPVQRLLTSIIRSASPTSRIDQNPTCRYTSRLATERAFD
jgi:Txe/YoeB family toxin of toxin-antitoxin system